MLVFEDEMFENGLAAVDAYGRRGIRVSWGRFFLEAVLAESHTVTVR
jgi:hypothetical protein